MYAVGFALWPPPDTLDPMITAGSLAKVDACGVRFPLCFLLLSGDVKEFRKMLPCDCLEVTFLVVLDLPICVHCDGD